MHLLRTMMDGVLFNKHSDNNRPIQQDERKYLAAQPSVDWKRTGNNHFAYKRYKDAIAAYTKGIEEGDSSIETLANRSYAYLHISDYKRALGDAELALSIDNTHIKCIYRKVRALFGMTLYRDAIKFLGNISLDSYSQYDREIITGLITEGECFASQSENGDYPWSQIHKTNSTFLEMAEYPGTVVVKEAPMKGRGLFATKLIEAGELVLASKAIANVENMAPYQGQFELHYLNRSVPDIHIILLVNLIEILKNSPEKHLS